MIHIFKIKALISVLILSFIHILSMILILSMIGHVSRWLNRRMLYLLLLIFVFSTAILLLVVLGLSVGVFSNFIPSLAGEPETQEAQNSLLSNKNIKTVCIILIQSKYNNAEMTLNSHLLSN
jgi:hypothetical protein